MSFSLKRWRLEIARLVSPALLMICLFYVLRSRRERDWHTRQGVSDPLRPQIFQCEVRQGDRQDVPEAAPHSGRTAGPQSLSVSAAMHFFVF